ncbi:MAG TPA: redoxin domain-containing protein [Anaerolineaceae bacterium]|nr:redoxin domain-containing protein [Anaerolineaceae bacterium]
MSASHSSNRRISLLLIGLALGVVLGAGYLWARDRLDQGRFQDTKEVDLKIGQPVPDFTLEDLEGNSVTLSQYRGRSVILNFWATWCVPCKNEMPLLEEQSREYADELVVLGVNAREGRELASAFVDEIGVSFPILLEQAGNVIGAYQVRGYPTTFFIDPDGNLRAVHIGELNSESIGRYLEALGIRS